jgi:hypothetical protein
MINALQLQYLPEFEQIVCTFSVEPTLIERLDAALFNDANRDFQLWDGEEGKWACGFIRSAFGLLDLGGDRSSGEIRIAMSPEYDPLDPSALPDIRAHWIYFVQPVKKILKVLR